MDENNSHDTKVPLLQLLDLRMELKSRYWYSTTGGDGDFTDENFISDINTPIPSLSSASLLEFDESLENKPNFSDDPSEWNRADYLFNIDFLTDSHNNQTQYLKHQEDKYERNKALISHIKSLLLSELDECERKKKESVKLAFQRDGYKRQINNYSVLASSNKLRFQEEERLNKELKGQKTRLEKFVRQLKAEVTDPNTADDCRSSKRQPDIENTCNRKRLQSRCCHNTGRTQGNKLYANTGQRFKLPNIKKEASKHLRVRKRNDFAMPEIVGIEEKRVAVVLPNINKRVNELVHHKEAAKGGDDRYKKTRHRVEKAASEKVRIPHPPTYARPKRFHRKFQNKGK